MCRCVVWGVQGCFSGDTKQGFSLKGPVVLSRHDTANCTSWNTRPHIMWIKLNSATAKYPCKVHCGFCGHCGFLTVNVPLYILQEKKGFLCHPGEWEVLQRSLSFGKQQLCTTRITPWYRCTYTGWLSGGNRGMHTLPTQGVFKVGSKGLLKVAAVGLLLQFLTFGSKHWNTEYETFCFLSHTLLCSLIVRHFCAEMQSKMGLNYSRQI